MKMRYLIMGLVAGMFIGVASASTVDSLHITKHSVIEYLNQVCAQQVDV